MLSITGRAALEIKHIAASKAEQNGLFDATAGVRIVVIGPDNGSRGDIEYVIGVDRERRGDKVEDIGGTKVLVDPLTSLRLQRIRAILDFLQIGRKWRFVLIIEGDRQ